MFSRDMFVTGGIEYNSVLSTRTCFREITQIYSVEHSYLEITECLVKTELSRDNIDISNKTKVSQMYHDITLLIELY